MAVSSRSGSSVSGAIVWCALMCVAVSVPEVSAQPGEPGPFTADAVHRDACVHTAARLEHTPRTSFGVFQSTQKKKTNREEYRSVHGVTARRQAQRHVVSLCVVVDTTSRVSGTTHLECGAHHTTCCVVQLG